MRSARKAAASPAAAGVGAAFRAAGEIVLTGALGPRMLLLLLLACAAAAAGARDAGAATGARDGGAAPPTATSVFLLKHGRSGSTWLTALLNAQPGVTMLEEAIKFKSLPTWAKSFEAHGPYENWLSARDPPAVDAAAAAELRRLLALYLQAATRRPVRHFHACTHELFQPDSRTVEESCALRTSKGGTVFVTRGITFAFHYFAAFIDLNLLAMPTVRIIVHVRVNVVKLSVSVKVMSQVKNLTTILMSQPKNLTNLAGHRRFAARDDQGDDDEGARARRRLKLCYANGQLEARGECVSRAKAPFSPNVQLLLEAVRLTISSNEVTCAAAARASRAGVAVHVTTYEAMQLRLDETLAAAAAFVGAKMPPKKAGAAPKKRGFDDLRGTLANFDAVEAALANASWANAAARPRLARLLRDKAPNAADVAEDLRIILPACAALLAACATCAHEPGRP